ncbi:MAG: beta-galactosidase trimerization domain-containing protein, partial [Fervidobacterium pennivorans]
LGMWVKQGYINGACGVMPFRFDQIRFAAEQYHAGLLDYAGRPSKRLEIYSELKAQTEGVVEPSKEVAIYFDYENEWIHRINHVNRKFRYWDSIVEIFKAVRSLGYNVDFLFPDEADNLKNYHTFIVPYAFKISKDFVSAIREFQGNVVMTCMSNLKDENNWIVERAPAELIDEFGLEIVDFGAIDENIGIVFNEHVKVNFWKDEVKLSGAEVLGLFDDGTPLLMVNKSRYYVASVLNTDGWKKILTASGILRPKFVGNNVEFVSVGEKIYVLNLKPEKNIVYVGSKKLEFSGFEMKVL